MSSLDFDENLIKIYPKLINLESMEKRRKILEKQIYIYQEEPIKNIIKENEIEVSLIIARYLPGELIHSFLKIGYDIIFNDSEYTFSAYNAGLLKPSILVYLREKTKKPI